MKAFYNKLFASSEQAQIALLGDEKAGKTTLLYRLKLPNWGKSMLDELAQMREIQEWHEDMKESSCTPVITDNGPVVIRDAGYHYELFRRPFEYGLWDMPGNPSLEDLWISFYRSIQFHAVVFVVDATNTSFERSRVLLHRALYATELRQAAVCVVINERKSKPYDKDGNEIFYRLDLHRIDAALSARVKVVVMDVSNLRGESDKRWLEVLDGIRKIAAKQGVKLG